VNLKETLSQVNNKAFEKIVDKSSNFDTI